MFISLSVPFVGTQKYPEFGVYTQFFPSGNGPVTQSVVAPGTTGGADVHGAGLGDNVGEPGVDVGEPGPDVGEPGVDVGEPGPDVGEPGPDVGEPGVDVGEPGVDVGEPGVDVGEPGVDVGEPGVDGCVPDPLCLLGNSRKIPVQIPIIPRASNPTILIIII
jgi:hypothetical protein